MSFGACIQALAYLLRSFQTTVYNFQPSMLKGVVVDAQRPLSSYHADKL